MRILWFSVTPSLFNPHSNSHNGGGWIASLEQIVRTEPSIQLGIAFEFYGAGFRYDSDGVVYYPIMPVKNGIKERLCRKNLELDKIKKCLTIIDDFKPDIIQIFGSENYFGLLCKHTNIPIVIHVQGCLPAYHNTLFPIGMNKYDFLFSKGLSWRKRFLGLRSEPSFRKRAEREIGIIKSCSFFMGRTEWDKKLINLFNSKAEYFHCEEALRDSFINAGFFWEYKKEEYAKIVSVISNPWYKGVDLILKTAKLLKLYTDFKFEWNVYGVSDISFYESKYAIKAKEVNVVVRGTVDKNKLVKVLCESNCYVHSSYIDNSPNSLCEAQFIGIPVLSTYVGGISTLIEDGVSGLLFPANDPYTLSGLIMEVVQEEGLATSLSNAEKKIAAARHNPNEIKKTILSIYNQIMK